MAQRMRSKTWSPRWVSNLSLVALASVASGCQTGSSAASAYAPPYPAYDYSNIAPAAGPQSVPQANTYSPVPYQALEAANLELKERLERVEKAMLRLDRRMQLVERNELSRMGTQTSAVSTEPTQQTAMSEEQAAMRALNLGPAQGNSGYVPVAARGNQGITSALQAAPSLSSASSEYNSSTAYHESGTQMASRNGLPSLADPSPAPSRALQPGNADVAIWTVRYEPSKVWPERDQLPASRDVVEALRRSSNANLTLYARGKNANAVEFRERVKALSRYLSKVSSLDSVPIAAMASPHMDDQTIEILVTH